MFYKKQPKLHSQSSQGTKCKLSLFTKLSFREKENYIFLDILKTAKYSKTPTVLFLSTSSTNFRAEKTIWVELKLPEVAEVINKDDGMVCNFYLMLCCLATD